jgi:hypothetical protein
MAHICHERIKFGRKLLRLHREIGTWVAFNRDRVAPDLLFAVEWMGCVLFYIGVNGLDAPDAKELLFKAFDELKAASPTLLRRHSPTVRTP